MKHHPSRIIVAVVLCLLFAATACVHAGTGEDVKAGSKKVGEKFKEDAVEAGKAVKETGKDIKDGSKETWENVKEGVKGVGQGFKKAYEDTRDAVRKEFSGQEKQTEEPTKDDP